MSIPTVTFDTNVWENIVDESKRESQEEYKKLFSLITSKSLTPYFLEGTVVMEGIPRDKRKEYIANYKANISFQVGDEKPIEIWRNHIMSTRQKIYMEGDQRF